MSPARFRPLVIGAPRSGFALLASVVINFVPLAPSKIDLRQAVLNALFRGVGNYIADEIVREFLRPAFSNRLCRPIRQFAAGSRYPNCGQPNAISEQGMVFLAHRGAENIWPMTRIAHAGEHTPLANFLIHS